MTRATLVGIIVTIATLTASADVAPFGGRPSRKVDREAVVTVGNLPDSLRIIVYSDSFSVVVDSVTLDWFSRLCAVRTALLDSMGGITGLRQVLNLTTTPLAEINLYPLSVASNSSLDKETLYYIVDGVQNGKVVLRLTKRVLSYDDGGDDVVTTY
jgi:hypothetical protein